MDKSCLPLPLFSLPSLQSYTIYVCGIFHRIFPQNLTKPKISYGIAFVSRVKEFIQNMTLKQRFCLVPSILRISRISIRLQIIKKFLWTIQMTLKFLNEKNTALASSDRLKLALIGWIYGIEELNEQMLYEQILGKW